MIEKATLFNLITDNNYSIKQLAQALNYSTAQFYRNLSSDQPNLPSLNLILSVYNYIEGIDLERDYQISQLYIDTKIANNDLKLRSEDFMAVIELLMCTKHFEEIDEFMLYLKRNKIKIKTTDRIIVDTLKSYCFYIPLEDRVFAKIEAKTGTNDKMWQTYYQLFHLLYKAHYQLLDDQDMQLIEQNTFTVSHNYLDTLISERYKTLDTYIKVNLNQPFIHHKYLYNKYQDFASQIIINQNNQIFNYGLFEKALDNHFYNIVAFLILDFEDEKFQTLYQAVKINNFSLLITYIDQILEDQYVEYLLILLGIINKDYASIKRLYHSFSVHHQQLAQLILAHTPYAIKK